MTLRSTHTYAELEVSAAAYDEIASKFRAAGYDHALMSDGTLDMHGIGLTKAVPPCGMCGDTKEVACSSTSYMACPACCGERPTK